MNLRDLPTVAVIGPGVNDDHTEIAAYMVGALLAERRCNLINGGLGGVMHAAAWGFAEKRDELGAEACGVIIGVLPENVKASANEYVDVAIATGIGEARNYVLVNSAEAIIAVGKGHGTLVEIGYALRALKRVVSLNSWEVDPAIVHAESPQQAVDLALSGG